MGRSINLDRVLWRQVEPTGALYYSHDYHVNLITKLASVDHPEACFKASLSDVYVEGHNTITPWAEMLKATTHFGHEDAKYVHALVLYRANTGAVVDNEARQLLWEVEGDESGPRATTTTWKNQNCAGHRHNAKRRLLDDLVLPQAKRLHLPLVAKLVPRQDGHQCRGGGCGDHVDWVVPWQPWGIFCSECRIRTKCSFLFKDSSSTFSNAWWWRDLPDDLVS